MPVYNVGYDATDNVTSVDDSLSGVTLGMMGGGSLTVDADAFLRNSSAINPSFAAKLDTGAWIVTVNGLLEQTGTTTGTALVLNEAGAPLKSTVLIGETGVVSAKTSGVIANHTASVSLSHATSFLQAEDQAAVLNGASSSISNKGYIGNFSINPVVEFTGAGNHAVNNSGNIVSGFGNEGIAIKAVNPAAKITITNQANSLIQGQLLLGGGNDIVTNSGFIGSLKLGDGNNSVTNLVALSIIDPDSAGAAISGGAGNDTIANAGTITGTIKLGDGDNRITGAGLFLNPTLDPLIELGSGNDTVTVTGLIVGALVLGGGKNMASVSTVGSITGGSGDDTVIVSKLIDGNVDLGGGRNSLTGAGAVNGDITFGDLADTLNVTGKITGDITLGAGTNTVTVSEVVTNAGGLSGGSGNDVITISKMLTTAVSVMLFDGKNSLKGMGGLTAPAIVFGSDDDVLALGGKITGYVDLGNAVTKNTATISELDGNLTGGAQNDVVTISKLLTGNIDFKDGNNSLIAAGAIHGNIVLGAGDDTVSLKAKLVGEISLGAAVTKNVAAVGAIDGAVQGGANADHVTVNGEVSQGVYLGVGADKLTLGLNGSITASAGNHDFLGAGNDVYIGNAAKNIVGDGDGSDTYTLLGGDDTFVARGAGPGTDGSDSIDGGLGFDSYDASTGMAPVIINLGSDYKGAPAFEAKGDEIGIDSITNFEHAFGGEGADVIAGTGGGNILVGNSGADMLFGLGGNDVIEGGMGADQIVGGTGADFLNGFVLGGRDFEIDIFQYRSVAESTASTSGRDLISDFEIGIDRLDFSAIDAVAKVGTAPNDHFHWLGKDGLFAGAGDMRYVHTKGSIATPLGYPSHIGDITVLSADVNGDKKADFAIAFVGHLDLQLAYLHGDLVGVV